jgi:hypothetical protein
VLQYTDERKHFPLVGVIAMRTPPYKEDVASRPAAAPLENVYVFRYSIQLRDAFVGSVANRPYARRDFRSVFFIRAIK